MRVKYFAALTGALAISFASFAASAEGFYTDVRAGVAEVETMKFSEATTANLTVNPGTGWAINGTLGYRLSDGFRVEGTVGYQRSKLSGAFSENVQVFVPCGTFANQPCLDPGVKGSLKVPSVFAMGYYDIPLSPSLALSLGAGVGAVWLDLDAHTVGRLNVGTSSRFHMVNDTDTVFGGRAAVDLTYGTGPTKFLVGYSYTRTTRAGLAGQGVYTTFKFDPRLSSHQITGGVRLAF